MAGYTVDLSNFSKNEFFQEQEKNVQISWEQEQEQEIQNMHFLGQKVG